MLFLQHHKNIQKRHHTKKISFSGTFPYLRLFRVIIFPVECLYQHTTFPVLLMGGLGSMFLFSPFMVGMQYAARRYFQRASQRSWQMIPVSSSHTLWGKWCFFSTTFTPPEFKRPWGLGVSHPSWEGHRWLYLDRGFRKWSFHAPLPRLGFLEFFHRFFLPENTCWNKSVFERLLSLAELLPLTDKEEKGPALLAQAEGNRDDRDGDDRRDDSGIINPSSSADNALSRPSLLKRWHWAP